MTRHYLTIAYRNLVRHAGATLIKLAGLSIGMACCMLILVYLVDELSFNKFNTHYKDIYRVDMVETLHGQHRVMSNAPVPVGPAIAQDIPKVMGVARMYNRSGVMEVARQGGSGAGPAVQKFEEEDVYFCDNAIFNIFSIRFREGAPAFALSNPNTVVITTDMARKYFGSQSALGKSLYYENKLLLQVTGVVDKLPVASDVHFDFLINFESLYAVESKLVGDFVRTNWLYNPTDTYVRLQPGINAGEVEPGVRALTRKYGDERAAKGFYMSLQPLSEIHLYASDVEGNPSTNSITYIYIFSAIAFLILLIANINFINLSNAQAFTRIGEISIRKVLGAGSRRIIGQFLGEGLVISFFAFLMALLLTVFGLPLLNGITGKQLHAGIIFHPAVMAVFLGLFICTGLLAGLYPALFVSRFRIASLLKGKTGSLAGGRLIRQTLIVTQFTIAVALIIGALVIHRQLQYLRNKPLGFRKSQMLVLPLFGKGASPISNGVDAALRGRMNAFEDDLRRYNAIDAVTVASVLPGSSYVRGLVIPEGHTEKENIFVPWASVDYDFVQTLGLNIVAGRDFSKQTGTDHLQAFILNESAVHLFGWKTPQDAIGKTMIRGASKDGKKGFVIGVVKDFNFGKLDRPLDPLIMDVNVPRFNTFAVQIRPDHIPATLRYIRGCWDKHFPDLVFEYSFLDEDISALYKAQENLSMLVTYFALIAIFLSCMGIFSLASFVAARRTREIGIRRVLGAARSSIVLLLVRDFQRLVLLALVLAGPLAWFLMNRWLHDFAYRTSISWWLFAAAGLGTLVLTWITLAFQGLKAARANPVDSLRTE